MRLTPTDPELFFSRNDATDPRFGELVEHASEGFPSEIAGVARIAIVGVAQHIGVERNGGRVGAAEAPDAIRSMLYRLTPYDISSPVIVPKGFVIDLGNIVPDGDDLEAVHERVSEATEMICRAGLVPLVLGGGHDTTYASARGVAAVHGTLGMLNFDAHLDLRPPVPRRNSGTSFRMLIDEGHVAAERFVEFGIQGHVNAQEHANWLRSRAGRIISLEEVRSIGFTKALSTAMLIATANTGVVYGTLDIDGVRAADAPGVSAPMPDGFSAAELLATARALGRRPEVAALDICEVNPRYDRDGITARLAAHAAMRFIHARAVAEAHR